MTHCMCFHKCQCTTVPQCHWEVDPLHKLFKFSKKKWHISVYQSFQFWAKIIINEWSYLAKIIKSRVEIKHFSTIWLMSPDSDNCWTRGLGLLPTGLGVGLGSNGLGLGLWSDGLGLTPDGLGLWPVGLGLGLGLWPCGLGLTSGLTSPDSLQHWAHLTVMTHGCFEIFANRGLFLRIYFSTSETADFTITFVRDPLKF